MVSADAHWSGVASAGTRWAGVCLAHRPDRCPRRALASAAAARLARRASFTSWSLAACSCHSRIRSAPRAVMIEYISSSSMSGPS